MSKKAYISYAAAETKTSIVNVICYSLALLLSFVAFCQAILFCGDTLGLLAVFLTCYIFMQLSMPIFGRVLCFLYHLVIPWNNDFKRSLRAAKQGDPNAWLELGDCYLHGHYVACNEEQAAACFEAAAELHLPEGQLQLARCYHHGTGVNRDLALAEHWYRKAHRGGIAHAAVPLAQLLGEGEDWKKDEGE